MGVRLTIPGLPVASSLSERPPRMVQTEHDCRAPVYAGQRHFRLRPLLSPLGVAGTGSDQG